MDDALLDVHCASCGYDLSGLDRNGACPECGVAVARSLGLQAHTGTLPNDTNCLGCGYDLAGLQPTGQCPECGRSIEETLTFRLAAQPLAVLDRLRAAPIWIFSGLGAQILLGFAGSAMVMIGITVWQHSRGGAIALAGVGIVLTLAIQVASFIGYWKLSTPLAGPAIKEGKHGRFRITVRVSSIIVLALSVLSTPLGFVAMFVLGAGAASPNPSGFGRGGMVLVMLNSLVGVLAGLAQLVRYLATAAYIHALASRIPDPSTAKLAKSIYRWTAGTLLAAVGLILIVGIVAAMTGGGSSSLNFVWLVPGIGLFVVAVIAFGLWIAWIVMLAKFLAKVSKVRARVLREAKAASA